MRVARVRQEWPGYTRRADEALGREESCFLLWRWNLYGDWPPQFRGTSEPGL